MPLQDLLARLAAGEVILGDGSYIFTLERRGYATAGMWTPESAAEHPEAVHQLGVEFARAGADVTQTFSFWCHEDKLPKGCKFSVSYLWTREEEERCADRLLLTSVLSFTG